MNRQKNMPTWKSYGTNHKTSEHITISKPILYSKPLPLFSRRHQSETRKCLTQHPGVIWHRYLAFHQPTARHLLLCQTNDRGISSAMRSNSYIIITHHTTSRRWNTRLRCAFESRETTRCKVSRFHGTKKKHFECERIFSRHSHTWIVSYKTLSEYIVCQRCYLCWSTELINHVGAFVNLFALPRTM